MKTDLSLPPVRGKILPDASLAPYTWFRVGGPADYLFLPADAEDLSQFLTALDPAVPVTTLGVGSNLIVRDGGIEGVVIRLMGKYWGLSGIPGSIGGATRTNAGCYGRELKDVLNQLEGVTRSGEHIVYQGGMVDYGLPTVQMDYRHSELPEDFIVTRLLLSGDDVDDPNAILADIETLQSRRGETQPVRDKTSGSTFANPDPPGTPDQRSAWKVIDAAGCRGLHVGGAQVSEKHCNFLINTGNATAADLEALGELVRARVFDHSGIQLRWEVRRIGRLQPPS